MTEGRTVASAKSLSLVLVVVGAFAWIGLITQSARTRLMQDLQIEIDCLMVSQLSATQSEVDILSTRLPFSGAFKLLSRRDVLSEYVRANKVYSVDRSFSTNNKSDADTEGSGAPGTKYSERLGAFLHFAVGTSKLIGPRYEVNGVLVRSETQHLYNIQEMSQKLRIDIGSSTGARTVASKVRQGSSLSFRLPVPGVDTSGLIRLPFAIVVWMTMPVSLVLIVTIGSRLQRTLMRPYPVDEPWLILDACSRLEKLVAIGWIAVVAFTPALCAFAAMHTVVTSVHHVDDYELEHLSFKSVVLPLLTLALGAVSALRSLRLVGQILYLRGLSHVTH